jgi:predicted nucleic acid-binding protein
MMGASGPWVVDASVVVKWILPESGSDAARAFLGRAATERSMLLAPELLWAEVANTLWKKASVGGGLHESEARAALLALLGSPISVVPQAGMAAAALQLGLALGITAYDALYVAVAEARDGVLVTFDTRLARKLRSGGFGERVVVPGA